MILHDGLMYVSLALLVGHLYLALIHPATRHALRGMTLGDVRVEWATKHHAKWEPEGVRIDRGRRAPRHSTRPRLGRCSRPCSSSTTSRSCGTSSSATSSATASETLTASDGDAARALIEEREPSLVVLDVMLPGTDGLSLCRWIRGRSSLPVILLTARGEEADRIVGLELGRRRLRDEAVLAARARGARAHRPPAQQRQPRRRARRSPSARSSSTASAARPAGPASAVQLTAKEFELLWFLASHPRHVFSRDQLMARVWGYEAAVDTGTVTVHVRRLREKIETDPARPRHLRTIWGVGYRLDP